jgi:hypothetical protein
MPGLARPPPRLPGASSLSPDGRAARAMREEEEKRGRGEGGNRARQLSDHERGGGHLPSLSSPWSCMPRISMSSCCGSGWLGMPALPGVGERGWTTSTSFVKPNTWLSRTPRIQSMFVFEVNQRLPSWWGHFLACHWTIAMISSWRLPSLPVSACVDVSDLAMIFFCAHSQVVRVVRHLDRLPNDGPFAAIDRSDRL